MGHLLLGKSVLFIYFYSALLNSSFCLWHYVFGFDIGAFYRGITRMGAAAAMRNNIDHQLFHSELDVQDFDKRHQFSSENVTRYKYSPY